MNTDYCQYGSFNYLTEDWLKYLYRNERISLEKYHWEMGLVCGFPKCCIKNFVGLVQKAESPGIYMDKIYEYDNINYVRCPKCRVI